MYEEKNNFIFDTHEIHQIQNIKNNLVQQQQLNVPRALLFSLSLCNDSLPIQ